MPIPTADAPGQVSLSHCLLDADGHVLSNADAERPYYAASTIKLHVMLAVLRSADSGALDLDGALTATRSFTGSDGTTFTLDGDHLDPTHPADGQRVSVRELLQRMIDRSSNEATNQLAELVGLGAVAEAIADLGLRATRVERLIGDAGALEAGLTNETSAADLARTMCALVRAAPGTASSSGPVAAPASTAGHTVRSAPSTGLSPASRSLALSALSAQRIPVIATSLRDGVAWGSKSGWVEGYRHDVAFIGDFESSELHVLAVMTAGMRQNEADQQIAETVHRLLPALTSV